MKIAVASDHAGFDYKERIKRYLEEQGYTVDDYGAFNSERSDYPDFGHKAAEAISEQRDDLGVLVCGSGIGISIAANRHPGVRAVDAVTTEMAKLARQHNDANVLALGERLVSWDDAKNILDTFLATPFEGGRHQARVEKIDRY